MNKGFALSLVLISLATLCVAASQPVRAEFQAPQLQWSKTYGPYFGYAVIQTSDGGYAIAGQNATYGVSARVLAGSEENNDNGHDAILVKIDQSGNLLWNKTFSEVLVQWIEIDALIETNDRGYAVAGSWNSTSWFAKTDSSGNMQWNKTYHLANWDNGLDSIAKTNDGGYVLGGFDKNGAWLVKTDSLGNLQWSRSYPAEGDFSSVSQAPDGGYVTAGETKLVKINALGNLQWNTSSNLDGTPWAVTITDDGGYAVAGFSSSSGIMQNVWFAKFAPESVVATASPSQSPTLSTFSLTFNPRVPNMDSHAVVLDCCALHSYKKEARWQRKKVDFEKRKRDFSLKYSSGFHLGAHRSPTVYEELSWLSSTAEKLLSPNCDHIYQRGLNLRCLAKKRLNFCELLKVSILTIGIF